MEGNNELRNELCEISAKLEEYRNAHKDVLITQQEYIDLREKEPEKKPIKKERRPIKTFIPKIVTNSLLFLSLAFAGMTCIAGISTAFFPFVSMPVLAFCLISLLISFGLSSLLIGEILYSHFAKKKYEETKKINDENREFNEKQYPKLKERYERAKNKLSLEYEKISKEAKEHIDLIEAYLKEHRGVINKKYYQDIDRIITVLDEQRATRLSDAINLVLRDKRIERTSGKQKKIHIKEDGLYPQDIMERAKVNPSNCSSCPRKDTCVRLYCQMKEYLKNKELDGENAQIKIKELPTKTLAISDKTGECVCKCVCTSSSEEPTTEKAEEKTAFEPEAVKEAVIEVEKTVSEVVAEEEAVTEVEKTVSEVVAEAVFEPEEPIIEEEFQDEGPILEAE